MLQDSTVEHGCSNASLPPVPNTDKKLGTMSKYSQCARKGKAASPKALDLGVHIHVCIHTYTNICKDKCKYVHIQI